MANQFSLEALKDMDKSKLALAVAIPVCLVGVGLAVGKFEKTFVLSTTVKGRVSDVHSFIKDLRTYYQISSKGSVPIITNANEMSLTYNLKQETRLGTFESTIHRHYDRDIITERCQSLGANIEAIWTFVQHGENVVVNVMHKRTGNWYSIQLLALERVEYQLRLDNLKKYFDGISK
eukprot:TRINITY_DN12643_c0_g1_i1.p1 TRINITY_DN12643_c0_g1~~TRINITY_DN12643_c0_g1_i1.p1  ORF type:complete len:177 (-),score=51.54 TRINITY_DN12643_c0_g1_i1:57-587(-)